MANYRDKISQIESVIPDHPLLPTLKSGESVINNLYADEISKTLPKKKELQVLLAPILAASVPQPKQAKELIVNGLLAQKYALKGQLNQASNKFHDCKTDEQRKQVSITVNNLFSQLQTTLNQIERYDLYGELPLPEKTEEKEDFFYIPEDAHERRKVMLSCRASISMLKKEIETYSFEVRNNKNHPSFAKWQNSEERLKRWCIKLEMINNFKTP